MEPLLAAPRREPVERTPVWFMRQAGRSLPEYREIRQLHAFDVVRDPELCAEVTLRACPPPRRRCRGDVRGHHAPGARHGGRRRRARRERRLQPQRPIASKPQTSSVRTSANQMRRSWGNRDRSSRASRRPGRHRLLWRRLHGRGYLVEGKPSRDFTKVKTLMYQEPQVWHALDMLTDTFATYVRAKADAARTSCSSSTRGSARSRSPTTPSSSRRTLRASSQRSTS